MNSPAPLRLTRTRQHKQVSPNGLPIVYVGRPGMWGNPFILSGDMTFINVKFRRKYLYPGAYYGPGDKEIVVELFKEIITDKFDFIKNGINNHQDDIRHWLKHFRELDITELRNKNLSCWCRQGQPCHGDVLLKLANEIKTP